MGLCIDLENIVRIDSEVKDLGIHIAYTVSWAEQNYELQSYPFENDVAKLIEYVKSSFTSDNLKDYKVVRAYRDFFWRLGIDPTKTRPASEALVRRALKGSFPRINHVVDAGNIASAFTLIPIGMYDLGKALPSLTIRFSFGGELFRPIGGKEEILDKGIPILVDSRGTVMHIYPHRDSIETCVTESAKKIITIAAGVPGAQKELVVRAIEIVVELLKKIGWRSCENIVYKS
ncbi:MAG: phenylalanine--tRNA ligase beta subunit-related protein [Ignisphaera sp.]